MLAGLVSPQQRLARDRDGAASSPTVVVADTGEILGPFAS